MKSKSFKQKIREIIKNNKNWEVICKMLGTSIFYS